MTDWGALYLSHVDALAALGSGLSDQQLSTSVPGTPAWTTHDVYAHLAGGPADQLSGRTEGAPGPSWTAQHVAERHGLPLAELIAELQANAAAMAEVVPDNPGPVWDIAVHHADLHEAFGLGVLPERLWSPVLEMLAPRRLGELPIPTGVAPYELFRALFSRRSRAQLRAWGGGLSDEQLDGIGVFGPRDDDQPVP